MAISKVSYANVGKMLLGAVVLALGGAGCTETVMEDEYVFTYTESGGFDGKNDQLQINAPARKLTFASKGGSGTAVGTEAEMARLEKALEAADFMHVDGPYECDGCSDGLSHDATLTMGGASHSVHWETLGGGPDELDDIRLAMDEIIHAHFPQEPPPEEPSGP